MTRLILVLVLVLAPFLGGCAAGAKMGEVTVALRRGGVPKNVPIQVETIASSGMSFAGDGSGDASLQGQERDMIGDSYAALIVQALTDKDFQVELASQGPRNGAYLILSGHVSQHDRGSISQRAFIGLGAGKASLTSHFTLADNVNGQVFAEFDVIASVSENPGFVEHYSYLEGHLKRSAKTVAQYLSSGVAVRY